ncbi:MAG: MBL fold metallo-hydrolase [Anaerolineae bacterium]
MQVTVLGSGAAEAIPDPFCRCAVCEAARQRGGPEIRARAAALVNRDLLIDLGPDLVSAANRTRLYLGDVESLLVTHRHSDHWLPGNLFWREPGFAATPVAHLTIYAPRDALAELEPHLDRATKLHVQAVTAGDRWRAGRYEITAVPATHGEGELEALLYVIDDGTHRLFYATDTSLLSNAAWDILSPLGPVDLVLLDETSGLGTGGSGHHGLEKFLITRSRLLETGVMGTDSLLVAHHFSHNGGLTHDELVTRFQPYGVTVAHDGLTFDLNASPA